MMKDLVEVCFEFVKNFKKFVDDTWIYILK